MPRLESPPVPNMQISHLLPVLQPTFRGASAGILVTLLAVSGCIENKVPETATRQSFCLDRAEVDCHVYFDCFEATWKP